MIARRIADYLDSNGITRTWLAKQIGVADSVLSRKLSGETQLNASEYKNICEALKVGYDEFMK